MKKIVSFAFAAMLLFGFIACSGDDDAGQVDEGTAMMSVKLVDAPGDYEHVYIDVQDVMIKYAGEEDEVSIGEINTGIYDLLELTGGVSVLLVEDEVPAGSITQMRLILGDQNTIVVDGETFPLSTPSAQQSGLKLNVNEDLEAGIFYEFILDFDVEESIVAQGNGGYSLKPVIRASTEAETGAISGSVIPLGFQTLITASDGILEISAYADEDGDFVVSGVPPGTYEVTVEADPLAGLNIVVVEDVNVTIGVVTDIGVIDLE